MQHGEAAHPDPSQPPCPRPGVPAGAGGRRGQPGEGGPALGHAGDPGRQEQGARRGGGCAAEAVLPGGLEEGQQPQPHPTAPRPDLPQVLQRLEARRQQVSEAEVAAVERQMEEARENIRKAEVGPERARGGLEVCQHRGVLGTGDIGTWSCSGSTVLGCCAT